MAKVLGLSGPSLVRLVAVLLIGWLFVLFCFVKPLLNTEDASHESKLGESDSHSKSLERLQLAVQQLDEIKEQNARLQELIRKLSNGENIDEHVNELAPRREDSNKGSDMYEVWLRFLTKDIQELGFFMTGQLKKLRSSLGKNPKSAVEEIDLMLERAKEHYKFLTYDLEEFRAQDGREAWREEESRKLRDLVFRRIQYLQNPKDCKSAKKIVCNLNKSCGYGCQVHHVTYCLIVAYATQRTMILNSRNWRYSKSGWEKVFLPVSETCTDASGSSKRTWPGSPDVQVIDLPIIDMISPRPLYLPPAVPKDLAKRISLIHGDPAAWWVSQFMGYLVRYQPQTMQMLNDTAKAFGFQRPIVGVHVRRTDKVGTEAAFHGIEEYMQHVKDYFDFLEVRNPGVKRRVYLASDDPSVLPDAISKYPDYEFLGDPEIAKGAAVATRYSDVSLQGVLTDIHFLAHSDYLVCTFSSQVCRVAYEMMQTMHSDASSKFRSLDDIYYFGGGGARQLRARFAHKHVTNDEISFEPGDALGIAGNHWDGFSKGQDYKSRQIGLFPSFKAQNYVEEVEMPTYPEVPEK